MKRNCSLDEISDGKLYTIDDLAQVNCNGCNGQASCCQGMGNSIILDPYDVFRLTNGLNGSFEELLAGRIELNLVDGIILPNLRMSGETERCSFLKENGRCSIHNSRPGICRIFPLGRIYENHDFFYFLQKNECNNSIKTMRKVSTWIDTPDYEKYRAFLIEWHYFLNDVEKLIKSTQDDNQIKQINMYLLKQFYLTKYDLSVEFYNQFYKRLDEAKELLP